MSTAAADRLSQAHQREMAAISGGVMSAVASLALGAEPLAISTWYWSVVDSMVSRVQAGYALSRQGTVEYLRRHAAAMGHPGVKVLPGSLDVAALRTSLEVTGPVAFKTAIAAGHDTDYALRSMSSQMAGASQRWTLAGERDTVERTAINGEGIVGWRRRFGSGGKSGKHCGFCAMLVGRGSLTGDGTLYRSERSASTVVGRGMEKAFARRPKRAKGVRARGGQALGDSYHDHCTCYPEPVYVHEREPADVRLLQRQWKDVTAGHYREDAMVAWNRWWNSRAVGSHPPVPRGSAQWRINQAYDRTLADAAKAEQRALRYAEDAYQRSLRLADEEYRRTVRIAGEAAARDARVAAETAARDARRAAEEAARASRRAAEKAARDARFRATRGLPEPAYAVRPSLASASSPAQVSRVLADEIEAATGRRIPVALRGSVETAREHAEGVLRMVERYPEVDLQEVATGPLTHSYAEYVPASRRLVFSERWSSLERRDTYLRSLRDDLDTGFHPTGDPAGVAMHEMGHAVDAYTGGAIRGDLERLLIGRDPLEVSAYAARNLDELVAEAVADVVRNGASAKPLSKAIVGMLDDAYASGRRGGGLTAIRLPSEPGRLVSRIDRALSPAEIIAQETRERTRALAAPLVKLEELVARSASGASTKVLLWYQRYGDEWMNSWLRRGRMRAARKAERGIPTQAKVEESIAKIDELMGRSRLAEDITVYRGVPGTTVKRILGEPGEPGSLVGREFTDKGFASTSADRLQASQFMAGEGFARDGVMLEVRVPQGTGAIQISNDSFTGRAATAGKTSEREILLDRGLRYRVVSDELLPDPVTGRPYRHVVVEVVPAKPAKVAKASAPKAAKAAAPKPAPSPYAKHTAAQLKQVTAERQIAPLADGLKVPEVRKLLDRFDAADAAGRRALVAEAKAKAAAKVAQAETELRAALGARGRTVDQATIREIAGRSDLTVRPLEGSHGVTTLETAPDGRQIVRKVFPRDRTTAAAVDSEELTALVFDALGLRAPAVARLGPRSLGIEYIDGTLGRDLLPRGGALPREILESDDGRLIGLADYLTYGRDRNPQNWIMLEDGRIAAIDFGGNFGDLSASSVLDPDLPWGLRGEFGAYLRGAKRIGDVPTLAATVDVSPADLAAIRTRLEALRPEFAAHGREDWFELMMANLDKLEARAVGTRSILGSVPATGPVDPVKLRAAVAKAKKAGVEVGPVKKVGTVTPAGKSVKYDPKVHQLPDGVTATAGAKVRVVEPGYQVTIGRETVWVRKPMVEVVQLPATGSPRIAALARREPEATARKLGGGAEAQVDVLTFPDGTRIVRKDYSTRMQLHPAEAKAKADREELGGLVAEALGVRTPAIARVGRDGQLYMEFIDGEAGIEIMGRGARAIAGIPESAEGRRIGLLDILVSNTDRNYGNWMRTADGHLVAIDHGNAFQGAFNDIESAFVDAIVLGGPPLSAGELAGARAALEPLRGEFERLGRLSWYNQMMARLAKLEKAAK